MKRFIINYLLIISTIFLYACADQIVSECDTETNSYNLFRANLSSIQEFVFAINATSRWGNQVPFTNITLDLNPPEDVKDMPVIYGGELIEGEKYKDFQHEMYMINKAFIEVMLEGDMNGRIFTFPIPTYNITKDFDWDSEIADLLFDKEDYSANSGDWRSWVYRFSPMRPIAPRET